MQGIFRKNNGIFWHFFGVLRVQPVASTGAHKSGDCGKLLLLNICLQDLIFRHGRSAYHAIQSFGGAERGRALNTGALVIALFEVFRQIAAGTHMRRLFTERAVKHGSALRLLSLFSQLRGKLRTFQRTFIQRHIHAGQRWAVHAEL